MADWERREKRIVLHRITYVIPSGSAWDVVQRALHQAVAEWRELAEVDRDALVPPEAVTWTGLGRDMRVRIEAEVGYTDADPEQAGDQPVEAPDAGEEEGRGDVQP